MAFRHGNLGEFQYTGPMRLKIETNVGRFAIISGVLVMVSLAVAVITYPPGIALYARGVFENLPLVLLLCLVWVIVVGFVKGWIQIVND